MRIKIRKVEDIMESSAISFDEEIEDEDLKDCPKCGCVLYENEKFCPKCGTDSDNYDGERDF